ncbi:hypothetical protein EYF80_026221 [Liparis tanakae]|uniref:Uncharacterized protein n=1 Tax=Liparis tanakae TaxID=230148 RepID=A0A4Z2HCL1_9TELE|nr:hypothetical protein EYF80_026221 [Liparis tanakae]
MELEENTGSPVSVVTADFEDAEKLSAAVERRAASHSPPPHHHVHPITAPRSFLRPSLDPLCAFFAGALDMEAVSRVPSGGAGYTLSDVERRENLSYTLCWQASLKGTLNRDQDLVPYAQRVVRVEGAGAGSSV